MKRIMCVDDDASMQNVFSLIFERAGYFVTICPDGNTIINNEHPLPDIYILDKQLSGMDGCDLCRFLKSQQTTRDIPVIMISASPSLAADALASGADGYLEKPFKLKVLLAMVEKQLTVAA